MKLPDFLEELNQGAGKAFGENAESMIDSLLYAELPPKLKRSVNMARLENGTYEEIVAHLERELELNALEESDDLPITTMASASTSSRSLLSTGIDNNKEAQCAYCKAIGHFYKNCPKVKKKKELEDKTGEKPQRPTYPPCDTCGKKNHPTERCWQGAGAHLRPKKNRNDDKNNDDSKEDKKPKKANSNNETSSSSQSPSKKLESKKLILPRLQIHDYMSVRQNVISDPPIINLRQYVKDTNGTPSVVWQQQMEKAYIKTYKTVHNDRPDRYYDMDYTQNFETQFRPLPLFEDYNPQYIDPDYGKDPYGDDELYDKQNLQFRGDDYPSTDDEEDSEIWDNKLTQALIELWQANSEAIFSEMEESYHQEDPQGFSSLLDETAFLHLLVEKEREPSYVPLSTNLGLKFKRRMLYFPMDFGELTLDGLIDTGAHSSAIPEADLRKIRLLAPQSIVTEGPAPSFQLMVANGDIETPKSTFELKFEVGDIEVHEIFIVMEKLSSPIIGLMFLQRNHTVLDMRQGVLNFPYFSMQLKTADHKYSNKLEPILNPEDAIISPNDHVVIPIQSQIYAENAVTGILQPSDLLHEEGDITFCAALVTLHEGAMRIRVNNSTIQPYKLKKGTHIANFSVMTPEQMKYVRPIDPVSTWHLLNENEEDAIYFISSLLKANRNSDQYKQYWFPTPENPGDETTHTPIQQRMLKESRNLQNLEQHNPHHDAESRRKFLSNFDCKDSMLQQHEIRQIENLLVEFYDIFARHRFYIGVNEEFTVKLTPKD